MRPDDAAREHNLLRLRSTRLHDQRCESVGILAAVTVADEHGCCLVEDVGSIVSRQRRMLFRRPRTVDILMR